MARPPAFTLPARCSVRHPAYLPASLRRQIRTRFDPRGIFLNIPYAPRYTRFELAIVSTATAYGLRPVLAKQQFDVRFKRILEMIMSCAFGFTDLSYEKRMNMPFELGIMVALGKDCFVVSQRRYSLLALDRIELLSAALAASPPVRALRRVRAASNGGRPG